ncbi:MAG TPA: PAS domain S-box protein [Methylomirabilota bacterium]|nr:PAS domain S-box protein [Methylomirabilota bacterium]
MFQLLFERSADAIWLFDPQAGVFVDCNSAAVELMRAGTKERLLGARPEDLSPALQPDGTTSREKTIEVVALVEKRGGHRFEWLARRFDGREVPLEVLSTAIDVGGRNLTVVVSRDISERKTTEVALRESEQKFRELFEGSSDAIQILDPQQRRIVDCNAATVAMAGGGDKEWFLRQPVETMSPERQPDGSLSKEAGRAWAERALSQGPQRFEWVARRHNGEEIPVEVLLTPVRLGGRTMLVSVSRDISERKKAERELLELNQSLERRVAERTAALTTSEAQFRALVEHAPEAIVVFNGDTGRFLFGNEHACRIYGVPMERLTELTPAEVSPEFQPCGGRSSVLAREKMQAALTGGMPVFEWVHRQPNGRLVPTEVRLLRLPAEGQNLVRASIIDNSERKRAEQALRESEEKFRALFEGSSQGVVLQDENQILEVNPAAVRIMGCQSAQELVGKHPSDTSPPFQPNGESSAAMARKFIKECLDNGSARFEWISRTPQDKEVPLEVALTRIQWSGRQVIQAFITDITERQKSEQALRDANRELRREIEQRTRAEASLHERVCTSMLSNDVALALNAGTELQGMLQQCAELVVGHLDVAFTRIWTVNEAAQMLELQASAGMYTHLDGPHSRIKLGQYKIGMIALEKKPHLTNHVQTDSWVSDHQWAAREGMVAFAGYPLLLEGRTLGVLALFARHPLGEDVLKALGSVADSIALGIERKRAQTALAESEARFSAAFQASPIFIAIARMTDGRFVLVNDAFVNWADYTREEILGKNTAELSVWERQEDREAFWDDLRRTGSVRQRECRFRNRHGRRFTILLSSEVIQINRVPHMLSLALDITERKQTEAELRAGEARLRESEARFSAAFEASPIFISMMRVSDEKYVLANEALVNWLGCTRDEVLGRSSADLGIWDDLAERRASWEELRNHGSIRQKEFRWRNRRGQVFTILLSAETIQVNKEPHVLSMALDITQRKQAEVEMLKALAREKELSQLKSNFVSMVSHEFRTPLAIIQSSAELLREFFQKMAPEERDEQLESITGNTRRMAGMMEGILVLSRLDAGRLDFTPSALDLDGFCRRAVDEVLSATSRRCPIELALAPGLPQARADERLLTHILTNLLSNAVKYSEPGGRVRFAVEREGAEARCMIRDEGIGISEEDQHMLFTAFHRGANVGSRAGTGLGLLLVKRCVELHHGKVRIESTVGRGTTVTVRLPVF